jgi:hypothetical protein
MSDFGFGGIEGEKKFDKIKESPFFVFSRPYLDFIGKGKIFNLVYFVMAGINLLLPFVIIFKVADSGIFQYGGAKLIVAFIFAWLVIAFACWIGFQLWIDRREKIAGVVSSEFMVTLIFSEIIRTFGEWLGTLAGIIGAGVGLITSIFLGEDAEYLFSAMGMDFMSAGFMMVIIGPVTGFFIIIVFRFLAEQLRLLASLVNNTKEIAAANLKKNANGA